MLKLSAPWTVYFRQIQALFKQDPEVQVFFNEDNEEIEILVDNSTKADALSKLLPTEKSFGNVTVKVTIVPGNKKKAPVNLVHDAFDDNKSVSMIYEAQTVFGDIWTFVVFKKEVIQFFNDNMTDLHGICSTLMEDIAREILNTKDYLFYCTDVDQNKVGKPLGEWP